MGEYSILLLAGEASGDHHAAALVRDLKRLCPEITVSGIGGDKLAAAGMELFHHYSEINTIGLSEGFGKVRNIISAYKKMKSELQSGRHEVFVPVDFPDVNLRLCKIARNAGVPVCYYISPQVWAWRRGRMRKIAARVDRMMTIFPFEERLYRDAGVRADFVGHTMVADIPENCDKGLLRGELDIAPDRYAIALLPGSRPAEIRRILPVMCEAARIHVRSYPDTQFVLPLAGEHLRPLVMEIASQYEVPVVVQSAEASRIMAACDSGLVTSGTATLQAALAGLPHAVVYKLDRLSWLLAIKVLKPLVMDKDIHVAIANVLAINLEKQGKGPLCETTETGFGINCQECGRPLFVPELLQDNVTPENLAAWLMRFRSEQPLRDFMTRGFKEIRNTLTLSEERPNAARIVLDCIQGLH
ncbi:MAG: lipid-A-disaccharide synthase [Candidatus Korobacteraceae bacterium]